MRHTIWTALEIYKEFVRSQSTSSLLKIPGPFFWILMISPLLFSCEKSFEKKESPSYPGLFSYSANVEVYELFSLGIWRHVLIASPEYG